MATRKKAASKARKRSAVSQAAQKFRKAVARTEVALGDVIADTKRAAKKLARRAKRSVTKKTTGAKKTRSRTRRTRSGIVKPPQ